MNECLCVSRRVPSSLRVGLQAVADVAAAIQAGYYDVGIAAGVETMTQNPMKWEGGMNPRVASSTQAQSCLIPMGVTSENVAERWSVTREAQDSLAARSHARAAAARKSGRFDSQIVPVHTTWKDPKTGEVASVTIDKDDGIREGVTLEALAKLPAVFKKGGSTTPGNASQVSDGAGCVVLARRSYATVGGGSARVLVDCVHAAPTRRPALLASSLAARLGESPPPRSR